MFPVAPPVEGRDWLATSPLPIPRPGFESGFESWSDLRGRVVVVVFWSFGCEASLLAMRRIATLAERWPDDVVVLAVHTPRFPYEEDLGRLRAAVDRNRIALPMVHDPDYITWNRYNPGGWPAVAVVGRNGRVVGMCGGTSAVDVIADVVATELATEARASSRQAASTSTPRPNSTSKSTAPSKAAGRGPTADESTLAFPAAVAASDSGLVVIADSGRDRLLIGELDSDLRTLRPEVEITDIDNPGAVALASESVIYVVERGTGSILQVDLGFGTLDILADEELAAPTALMVDHDGSVVVADAGHDMLFRIAGGPDGDVVIGPIAGSGFSGTRDGNAGQAELAQPVGLARTASGIAFCDAASSNVRLLTDDGRVLTITGSGLFDWGLVDGPAHRALLQRPGGLCRTATGDVLIVDTGNDRIRLLENRRVRTLGLSGLNQPSDAAALGTGHLIIADTGNHRLVVADPEARTGWPLAVYPAAMTSVWDPAEL